MPSLPRQLLIEPRVEHHALRDPIGTLFQRLHAGWPGESWAGRRVVVGVGSRGIDRIAEVTRAVVSWLRQQGAEPVVALPKSVCGLTRLMSSTASALSARAEITTRTPSTSCPVSTTSIDASMGASMACSVTP